MILSVFVCAPALAQEPDTPPNWNSSESQKQYEKFVGFPIASIFHKVNLNGSPVKQVIAEICSKGGATAIFDKSFKEQKVTASFTDLTTDELLSAVLNVTDLRAKHITSTLVLIEAKGAAELCDPSIHEPDLPSVETILPTRVATFENFSNSPPKSKYRYGLIPPPPPPIYPSAASDSEPSSGLIPPPPSIDLGLAASSGVLPPAPPPILPDGREMPAVPKVPAVPISPGSKIQPTSRPKATKVAVLPAGFFGYWDVSGQRTKVEALPEFQAGAEAVFAPNTRNVWKIGGDQQSGYSLSNDQGVSTQLVVDRVEGNTAFIRYQHPIKNTVAGEAIVISLVPGGAQFNGLERVSISMKGVVRAKVTYQLVGRRSPK